MIWVLVIACAWAVVAFPAGILIGMGIKLADEQR